MYVSKYGCIHVCMHVFIIFILYVFPSNAMHIKLISRCKTGLLCDSHEFHALIRKVNSAQWISESGIDRIG